MGVAVGGGADSSPAHSCAPRPREAAAEGPCRTGPHPHRAALRGAPAVDPGAANRPGTGLSCIREDQARICVDIAGSRNNALDLGEKVADLALGMVSSSRAGVMSPRVRGLLFE